MNDAEEAGKVYQLRGWIRAIVDMFNLSTQSHRFCFCAPVTGCVNMRPNPKRKPQAARCEAQGSGGFDAPFSHISHQLRPQVELLLSARAALHPTLFNGVAARASSETVSALLRARWAGCKICSYSTNRFFFLPQRNKKRCFEEKSITKTKTTNKQEADAQEWLQHFQDGGRVGFLRRESSRFFKQNV